MKQRSATAKRKFPGFSFFGNIISELKKVTWLSRRELIYLTGLVLLVTVIMALILGVLDYGFTRLVNDIFIGG
jgi:preprotein translocase subunit SecE